MKSFTLVHQDEQSKARVGILHTSHSDIPTPVFMPVGTQGTVKAMAPDRLKAVGVKMLLGNSYHLHLRPGEDLIREMGVFIVFVLEWFNTHRQRWFPNL